MMQKTTFSQIISRRDKTACTFFFIFYLIFCTREDNMAVYQGLRQIFNNVALTLYCVSIYELYYIGADKKTY